MKQIMMAGLLAVLGCASCQHHPRVIDKETLLKRAADVWRDYEYYAELTDNAREHILEGGVSPEWVTAVLERQVRKYNSKVQRMRNDYTHFVPNTSQRYLDTRKKVKIPMAVLREFPGPNTLELLRKCALSKSADTVVSYYAVDTYVAIAGGDAVPFLRKFVSKDCRGNIHAVSQDLHRVIKGYQASGRHEDAAKLNAFLLEHLQTENDWQFIETLDNVLLDTLEGYAGCDDRVQAFRRIGRDVPEAK